MARSTGNLRRSTPSALLLLTIVLCSSLLLTVDLCEGSRALKGFNVIDFTGQQQVPAGSVIVFSNGGYTVQPHTQQQQQQQQQQQPQQQQWQPQQQAWPQQQPQQQQWQPQQQPQQEQWQPQQQPQQQQQQQQQPDPSTSSGNAILDLHNSLRAKHHAPPLVWSQDLVNSAQNWANNLVNSCSFYHSGPGENMASGYANWNDVIMAFYNEINMYNYAAPGYSAATGHATQLLWVASQQLGCATAQSASCWENIVYVCHYYPVGNVNSPEYFQANVLAP